MATPLYKLIALYTANAYIAEREMSASACTHLVQSIAVLQMSSVQTIKFQLRVHAKSTNE